MLLAVLQDDHDLERCRALAASLSVPLWQPGQHPVPELVLAYSGQGLGLQWPPPAKAGSVRVDFASEALKWRLQGADLLVKAVRGRRRDPLVVIDATAGLGRDSYALAARGFDVVMLERSPVVAALLQDGLQRGQSCDDVGVRAACQRLQLLQGEAADLMKRIPRADVVYLDPMFPERDGQALAKKEMQLFQRLLGEGGDDADSLLETARRIAKLRVVVKRPRKAPPLAGATPSHQLQGRAVRFDVYAAAAD